MTTENNQFEFKAEVKQLLNILVHSLYTNRDIFLRELISNASDALDKLKFESNRGTEYPDKDLPLEISIKIDKEANQIIVSDTGIGMTKEDLINHIGTIAKSGSAEFLQQLAKDKDSANNIIGKFGVGFYSVFMVAKEVTIRTKSFKAEENAIEWVSDGLGSYTLNELEELRKRGTEIVISLNDESKDFAEKYRLENIIKTHSNFITFPIKLEGEQVNKVTALWREPKSSITKEQYKDFYNFLSYDSEEPLETIHSSVDAPIQFNSLMFIPAKTYDLFGFNRDDYGLDLYVRRVLIQHKNKDLLPEFLAFVKGVVDSEDLPLNISRETLQEDLIFSKISQSVTNQVFSALQKMADKDSEKYQSFWKEHGRVFKLGYGDYTNRDKYSKLLRFNSSYNDDEKGLLSLEEYIEKAKENQKEIYYAFGASRAAINMDPHLEIFKSKGIGLLYLYDPVDEFVMSSLRNFNDYEFKSVDQVDLKKLEEFETVTEKKNIVDDLSKDDELHLSSLLSNIKEILGDKVTEVRASTRLTDSPACLINPDDSMSSTMQKIMNLSNKDNSIPKRAMEINKDHKLIRNLLHVFKSDTQDPFIKKVVDQLYDSSLLLEGYLNDPHSLVQNINSMLEESSGWYVSLKKK
ncbi:MAG: molecular chaperone HtpG [Bacteroidetes bacterium]|nr:molecular chaperone HtpG [Bacteroidota bacterium]